MFNVNRVTLLGNVTRDPEPHATKTGTPLSTIGFATNRSWKDAQGEIKKEAEFHRLICWSTLAEFVGKTVKKGQPLYVEGRIHTNKWKSPEGKDESRTEIIVERLVLLSARKTGETEAAEGTADAEEESEAA